MEPTVLSTIVLWLLGAVMVLGLLSLLVVIVPGLTIIWAAILVYFIMVGYTWQGLIIFIVCTLLMLGGNLVDNFFLAGGARKSGASWLSIGVMLVCAIVGSILWPPIGGLILALVGLMVVEIIRIKDFAQAARSAGGILKGLALSIAARFGIGVVMIGLWLLWVLVVNK
jgi:uncharacterized protein YqgC (DUF456 family)